MALRARNASSWLFPRFPDFQTQTTRHKPQPASNFAPSFQACSLPAAQPRTRVTTPGGRTKNADVQKRLISHVVIFLGDYIEAHYLSCESQFACYNELTEERRRLQLMLEVILKMCNRFLSLSPLGLANQIFL